MTVFSVLRVVLVTLIFLGAGFQIKVLNIREHEMYIDTVSKNLTYCKKRHNRKQIIHCTFSWHVCVLFDFIHIVNKILVIKYW